MNELSQTVEELRTAAKLLISAAESIARLFSEEASETDSTASEASETTSPELTLEEVRGILSEKCAQGYGSQVKALIASYGAKTLKEVAPADYNELALAAQALGREADANA